MFFWKKARRAQAHQHPVYRAFLLAAKKWPKRVAVRHEGIKVSYRQLYDQVLTVASHLSDLEPAGPIAICYRKSRELPALFFGVLGAGRAYLYLDPDDSVEQHRALIRSAGCVLVVVEHHLMERYRAELGCAVSVISAERCQDERSDAANVAQDKSAGVCCFIQTSGSTGRPKLVAVSSEAVLNNASNFKVSMQLGLKDKVSWLSSPKVAASNSAFYGALLYGAALCPFQLLRGNFGSMAMWMKSERVTLLHMTPSLFRAMVRHCDRTAFERIRGVKLGGESVYPLDLCLFHGSFLSTTRLVNGLGMSEAGGNVCHCDLTHFDSDVSVLLPVGAALPGYELSVIDAFGAALKPGAEGEIVLKSALLTDAYLGADAGVGDFLRLDDGRIELRTGDLGYFNEENMLFFIGRKDRILKIRGFRVDLNLIEAELLSINGVDAVMVTASGLLEQRTLVAFVETTQTRQRIREKLARALPDHMLPSRVEVMAVLPRTAGGKVDQQSLLARMSEGAEGRYVKPRTELEARMVQLVRGQLPDAKIGVYDDFFDLGGDSLKALELIADITQEFHRPVSTTWLIQHSTVERMIQGLSPSSMADHDDELEELGSSGFSVEVLKLREGDESQPWLVFPGGFAGEDELLVFTRLFAEMRGGAAVYGVKLSFGPYWEALPASFELMQRAVENALKASFNQKAVRVVGECVSCPLTLAIASSIEAPVVYLLDPKSGVGAAEVFGENNRILDPIQSLYELLRGAEPAPYLGKVHVISSAAELPSYQEYASWWACALKEADVTCSSVGGDHYSYLRAHRKELADLLSKLARGA